MTSNDNSTAAPRLYRPPFGLVQISGPDAERYLHGRISQDVKKLPALHAARSLVLTPQGRVLGQFFIYRRGPADFICASDPLKTGAEAEDFVHALLQFKVADQLTGRSIDSEYSRYLLIGTNAGKLAANLPGDAAAFPADLGATPAIQILAPLASNAAVREKLAAAGAQEIGRDEFESLAVIGGFPLYGCDITEKTLAPELNLDPLVSFNKGCYAGQEVVEMAAARGRANRRLKQLKAAGRHEIATGAELTCPDGPGGGVVTSSAFDPASNSTYVLAYLKSAEGIAAEYLIGDLRLSVQPA